MAERGGMDREDRAWGRGWFSRPPRSGQGHTFAAHLLREEEVYLVEKASHSMYQLVEARTRRKVGDGNARFLKEWFRFVRAPVDEEVSCPLCPGNGEGGSLAAGRGRRPREGRVG